MQQIAIVPTHRDQLVRRPQSRRHAPHETEQVAHALRSQHVRLIQLQNGQCHSEQNISALGEKHVPDPEERFNGETIREQAEKPAKSYTRQIDR